MDDLAAQLLRERFGPPPVAEARRPLTEALGTGGPDTPQAIAARRRVLLAALDEFYGAKVRRKVAA